MPKLIKYLVTKEKYSFVDISDLISSELNLPRKPIATGRLIK